MTHTLPSLKAQRHPHESRRLRPTIRCLTRIHSETSKDR